MITTKTGRATGFGAAAIIAALGFAGFSPHPRRGSRLRRLRLRFSDRVSVLLSALALSVLSAAGLLSAAALLLRRGLLRGARDIISTVRHLCPVAIRREPVHNLHATARLDQRAG